MSAIFGIVAPSSHPVEPAAIERMVKALPEFNLDGSKSWYSPEATFACSHMVTDLFESGETYPYEDKDSGLIITADARIDNRAALRRSLSIIDPEDQLPNAVYILKTYQKWGNEFPLHLLGDFAISIWDPLNSRLTLARDTSGIKPLYYAGTPTGFAFSSHLNSLFALKWINPEINEKAIAEFLVSKFHIQKSETYFHSIMKLPQAQTLCFQQGRTEERTYWSISDVKPIRYKNDLDYLEHFEQVFTGAVERCLRTSRNIGCHISGGLDSTLVTLVSTEILNKRGQSLSAAYTWSPKSDDQTAPGELELIEWVSKTRNIPVRYCDLSPELVAKIYARDFTREPTNTLLSEVNILQQAKEDHIRVMLSGWGGDEIATFNGRGYFLSQILNFRWGRFLSSTRSLTSAKSFLHSLAILKTDFERVYGMRSHKAICQSKAFLSPFLTGSLAESVKRIEPQIIKLKPDMRANQVILWDLSHLANRMEDWHYQGAIFGIEYRYPFLDRELVEYCMGIPEEILFSYPWRGVLVRKFAENYMPEKFAWSALKREDHRQPIFQKTKQVGFALWINEIIQMGQFRPEVSKDKLISYLMNYNVERKTTEENRRLQRLLQVAILVQQ